MLTRPQQPHPGCYDRPPHVEHYVVKDGYSTIMNPDGTGVAAYRVVTIPWVFDPECHIADEPRCDGCKWRPT